MNIEIQTTKLGDTISYMIDKASALSSNLEVLKMALPEETQNLMVGRANPITIRGILDNQTACLDELNSLITELRTELKCLTTSSSQIPTKNQ